MTLTTSLPAWVVAGAMAGPAGAEPTSTEPEAVAFGEAPDPAAEPIPGAPAAKPKRGPGRVRASANEGFGLDSADGRFGFSLGILGQMRYAADVQQSQFDHGFTLRLARTMVQGHLWGDRLTWQLQPEFAGGARLLDANAIVKIHPAFSILVGQYRPWFTRGFPTNLPLQTLPDRGPVLDAFRIDRDVGVTFMGQPFAGRMEYYVGVLDGDGVTPQGRRNPQPLLTARLVGAPLGGLGYSQTTAARADGDLPFRFAFAANVATNEVERTGLTTDPVTGNQTTVTLPDTRMVVVGSDVALQGWRIMAMGEGFWRRNVEQGGGVSDAWGTYGQVSGVLVRKRLEVTMRVGALRLEGDTESRVPLEPGFNVYGFGDHAKLQLRYRCIVGIEAGECLGHGGDLQAQLWF